MSTTNTFTLYKRAKGGKVQQWSIEVDGGRFRTTEGFVDGKLTTTEWTVCEGKNLSRANATTPAQQAAKEVSAKVQKQKDKGYTEQVSDVDTSGKKISPMLAHKWDDHKDWALAQKGWASQPKFDGIRCVATRDGLFSRNGKPILAAPHIFAAVKPLLDKLPVGVKFDGELYNHEFKNDFNKIVSLVRKQNPTDVELEDSARLVQYHIYDIDDSALPANQRGHFFQRNSLIYAQVIASKTKCLKIVDTNFLGGPIDLVLQKLDEIYTGYLIDGYEGQMIRISESYYDNSRSKNLLKRKEFQDGEFKILDIEEGKGERSGMMGRIKFDGFDSNARGDRAYFTELLKNKFKYIGKMATVRYQNLTPDGKPRFPVMIAIRDYE